MSEKKTKIEKIETWSDIEETVKSLRNIIIEELKYTDNPMLRKKLILMVEILNMLTNNLSEYLEMRKRESRRVRR